MTYLTYQPFDTNFLIATVSIRPSMNSVDMSQWFPEIDCFGKVTLDYCSPYISLDNPLTPECPSEIHGMGDCVRKRAYSGLKHVREETGAGEENINHSDTVAAGCLRGCELKSPWG
jgi:hypothetical protein